MTKPRAFRSAVAVCGGWGVLRGAALLLPIPALVAGPHLLPGDGHLPFEAAAEADSVKPAAPSSPRFAPPPVTVAAATVPTSVVATDLGADVLARLSSSARGARVALTAYRQSHLPLRGFSPAFLSETAAPVEGPAPAEPATASRWSGSAWAFVRQGSGRDIATAGQLGGSQAGVRLAYKPWANAPVAVFGRATSPLGGDPGAELAIGVDWQPVAGVPVRVSVERRDALDHAGRNAFALVAAGGVYAKPLPAGFRLDAYAQTGVVGARRRDLFVDGGARVGEPLAIGHAGATLTLGGGAWGAAQPGVARLDLGPQAALRLPTGRTGITVAADWRMRVAGNARPGSGPALTVAADF